MVHGDARPRMELWSRRDPVTLFGAIGMSESGWDQLSQTFSWAASSIAGRPVEPVTVRMTHIYRRADGGWKMVHRHPDNPGDGPRPTEGQP
jgi:hypothetical protein